MLFELRTGMVSGKEPFQHGPEQDYLTRFYAHEEWTCLGIQWNFQLHQIAYCCRPGLRARKKAVKCFWCHFGVAVLGLTWLEPAISEPRIGFSTVHINAYIGQKDAF